MNNCKHPIERLRTYITPGGLKWCGVCGAITATAFEGPDPVWLLPMYQEKLDIDEYVGGRAETRSVEFEHKATFANSFPLVQAALEEFSKDGWELINVYLVNEFHHYMYFKRPVIRMRPENFLEQRVKQKCNCAAFVAAEGHSSTCECGHYISSHRSATGECTK